MDHFLFSFPLLNMSAQANLNLKRIIKWTTFTSMIVPMGKFGKCCNASRNAEQASHQATSSGSVLQTSGTVARWSHKNVVCCFGCHRSLSLSGFMTVSAQFIWGGGTNSTGESGWDRPGGSHSSVSGVEHSVPCGREPEISKSSCVHRVAEDQRGGGGAAAEVKFHICLGSNLLVFSHPGTISSLQKISYISYL